MKYEIHPDGTMTLNPAYTEILRLDKMLTEKSIDHTTLRFLDGYRVGVNYDGREIGDAIEHYFSYGNKENLLETMGFDEDNVTGHRTAEDVMTVVEAAIERKRGYLKMNEQKRKLIKAALLIYEHCTKNKCRTCLFLQREPDEPDDMYSCCRLDASCPSYWDVEDMKESEDSSND